MTRLRRGANAARETTPMLLLATCAFIFGLLGQLRLTVVPFAAANLALLAAIGLWGALEGLSAGSIALHAFIALVAAQAGYASRVAYEIFRAGPPTGRNGAGPRADNTP